MTIPDTHVAVAALRATTDRVRVVGDCLISDRTPSHTYARLSVAAGMEDYAHRVVWRAANGAIPDGWTVDHTCRNTKCVNVDHLRLLSNVDNGRLNGNAVKDVCAHGHSLADAYVYTPTGRKPRRTCRTCKLMAMRLQGRA